MISGIFCIRQIFGLLGFERTVVHSTIKMASINMPASWLKENCQQLGNQPLLRDKSSVI